MKKLLFFDIDGTIITESDEGRMIPDSLVPALEKLKHNGHLCFVNTGRSYAEIEPLIRKLPFLGFVCGCGTHIISGSETLLSATIPFSLGNEIIADIYKHDYEFVLEGKDSVYYKDTPYQTQIGTFRKEHENSVPDAVHYITALAKDLTFDKFCIWLKSGQSLDGFYEKYSDTLTFIDRKGGFYEIMPKGYSKATGIAFLENHFQIPHEHTIAIGDSTNDLPMLEYAAYSIAMGNSKKELFPVVDYVTGSVMNDGIYTAMQHLDLI